MRALPRGLLQELGHIIAIWGEIEQYLILWTSALTSQDYDGEPTGDLRSDFKRLREKWWREAAKRLSEPLVKTLHPINMRLSEASKLRGDLMHGTWHVVSRGVYRWEIWEQRGALTQGFRTMRLSQLRGFREALEGLLDDLKTSGG